MAIVGHWLVGFVASYCFPQTGVALFLKLSMASDGAVLLFSLLGLESAMAYASWMPSVPSETSAAIAAWKRDGKWLDDQDPTPGVGGFAGFDVSVAPLYWDVSYSHSVLFCALMGAAFAVVYRIRCPAAARPLVCAAVWATVVSHPLMDIFFHDACLAMSHWSRAVKASAPIQRCLCRSAVARAKVRARHYQSGCLDSVQRVRRLV